MLTDVNCDDAIDTTLMRLARTTGSVVHASALRVAGIGRDAVARRVRSGMMAEILPRVYGVGPDCIQPTFAMSCMAAALHMGPDARLSGHAGARLLVGWDRGDDVIDVCGTARRTDVPGRFRFHRQRGTWLPGPPQLVGPLPVLNPPRLCLELATTLDPWQLAFVIGRMRYAELVTLEELDAVREAYAGRRGSARLQQAITLVRSGCAGTRSRSEDEFRLLVAGASLRAPDAVNVRGVMGVPSDEPDFLWRRERLNVEIDGRQHLEPAQAAADVERDLEYAARGWRVLRFQAIEVWRQPRDVIARVRNALSATAASATHRRANRDEQWRSATQ